MSTDLKHQRGPQLIPNYQRIDHLVPRGGGVTWLAPSTEKPPPHATQALEALSVCWAGIR